MARAPSIKFTIDDRAVKNPMHLMEERLRENEPCYYGIDLARGGFIKASALPSLRWDGPGRFPGPMVDLLLKGERDMGSSSGEQIYEVVLTHEPTENERKNGAVAKLICGPVITIAAEAGVAMGLVIASQQTQIDAANIPMERVRSHMRVFQQTYG